VCLQDELRVKDNQLQLLGVRLEKCQFENQQLRAEVKLKSEQLGQLQTEMQEILARSYKQMEIQQLGTDLAY
jgi:predicted RNase H-like nuclease (RuvC/YqgF family)